MRWKRAISESNTIIKDNVLNINSLILRIEPNSRKAVYSLANHSKDKKLIKFLRLYRNQLKKLIEPYFYFQQELQLVEDVLFDYEEINTYL